MGTHLLRRSVAVSTEHTFASGFRPWSTFQRLIGADQYISGRDTGEEELWAPIDFAAWCNPSEGNQASSIMSKTTAVQYLHRIDMGTELPTWSALIKSVLKGIARAHMEAGKKRRTRLPISLSMIRQGEDKVDRGAMRCGCVSVSDNFLMGHQDEVFASDSGIVHLVHCVTRDDVTFINDGD